MFVEIARASMLKKSGIERKRERESDKIRASSSPQVGRRMDNLRQGKLD